MTSTNGQKKPPPSKFADVLVNERFPLRVARQALEPMDEIVWNVDGIVQQASFNCFAGEPGSYKTWITLYMAVCIAMGVPFLGRETRKGRVLFIDEESGQRRFDLRLSGLMRAMDAPENLELAYLSLPRMSFLNEMDVRMLRQLIADGGFTDVFVDALIDVTPGADENSATEMQPPLMAMRETAEVTGASLTTIHHAGKDGRFRGSSAIEAAVDLMLLMKVESGIIPSVKIETKKARDAEPFKLGASVSFHDLPFRVYVDPVEMEQGTKLGAGEHYVLDYLEEHGPSKVTEIMASVGEDGELKPSTIRSAVYSLRDVKLIHRIDDGGQGIPAIVALKTSTTTAP